MRDKMETIEWRAEALTSCTLGEGPVWDEARSSLWFVDIKGAALHQLHLAATGWGRLRTHRPPAPATAIGLTRSGALLLTTRAGVQRFRPETGAVEGVAAIEPEAPGNRPNDGAAGPDGRFYFGTMDDGETKASGAFYRLDADGGLTRLIAGVGISNGVDWSPDHTRLYFTDSMRSTIWAYPFDAASGTLGPRAPFAVTPTQDGWPDGLTVDAEGFVWSAHWDGWRLTRYAPDGRIDRVVRVPVPRPTSCAFGGEGLRTLFVTTASIGLDAETRARAPLSGALLAADVGVAGVAPYRVAE